MARPTLSTLQLWPNHFARVCDVLSLALEKLIAQESLPENEKLLTVEFSKCVRTANRELRGMNRGVEWPPSFDGIQGKFSQDEESIPDAEKRPDIKWGMYDSAETDPDLQEKSLDVECKRLGEPTSKNWVLTRQYVCDGVYRFVSAEHRYGRFATDGVMVGYVQNRAFEWLLEQVNQECSRLVNAVLRLSEGGWKHGGTTDLKQTLNRAGMPTPFNLAHFWIDLRRPTADGVMV